MHRVMGFHERSANHVSDVRGQIGWIAVYLHAALEVIANDVVRINHRRHGGKQRHKRNEDDLVHDAHVTRRYRSDQ